VIPAGIKHRLLAALERAEIDTIVAHTYGSIRHLTGGWYSFNYSDFQLGADHQYLSWLIIDRKRVDEPVYLCSELERTEAVLAGHPIADVAQAETCAGFRKAREAGDLARVLAERGLDKGRVGLELPFLPGPTLEALRESLGHVEVVDGHPLLLYVRAVKTTRELELLASAARVVEVALQAVFARAAEGVDDTALEREALVAIATQGAVPAQRYILPGIGPGRRRYGAGNPVSQKLSEGDVLLVDLGAKADGMHGDIVRVGVLGNPSFPVEDAVELAAAANTQIASFLQPGMRQTDAFMEAKRIVSQYAESVAPWGRPVVLHHGLGWSLYEPPFDLTWHGSDEREPPQTPIDPYELLEEGMVFSLETAVVSVDGSELYCNIEDPYVLTEDGAKRLNAMPPDVVQCGAGTDL